MPDWLGGEQPYDLNSWQESETALALAETLDEDAVIVEGYAEYATWRPHLAYLRDPYGDGDMEMELDGVGGVSILAKARVFRAGVHFPAFSFEKHAETEGFGKVRLPNSSTSRDLPKARNANTDQMAKRMGFSVIGLPHYTIWHLYEPSVDDLRHMEEMEQERKAREQEEKELAERKARVQSMFKDTNTQSEIDNAFVRDSIQEENKEQKAAEPVSNDGAKPPGDKPAAKEPPANPAPEQKDAKDPLDQKAPGSLKGNGIHNSEEAPAIKPAKGHVDTLGDEQSKH